MFFKTSFPKLHIHFKLPFPSGSTKKSVSIGFLTKNFVWFFVSLVRILAAQCYLTDRTSQNTRQLLNLHKVTHCARSGGCPNIKVRTACYWSALVHISESTVQITPPKKPIQWRLWFSSVASEKNLRQNGTALLFHNIFNILATLTL